MNLGQHYFLIGQKTIWFLPHPQSALVMQWMSSIETASNFVPGLLHLLRFLCHDVEFVCVPVFTNVVAGRQRCDVVHRSLACG